MAKKLGIDELLEKPQAKTIIAYLRNIKEGEDGVFKRFEYCYVLFGKLKKELVNTHKLPNEKALVRYLKILCDLRIIDTSSTENGKRLGYRLFDNWGALGVKSVELLKIQNTKASQIKWEGNCTYYGLDVKGWLHTSENAQIQDIDWKFKETYYELRQLHAKMYETRLKDVLKKLILTKKIKLKTKCDILKYLNDKYYFWLFECIIKALDAKYYIKYHGYPDYPDDGISRITVINVEEEDKNNFLKELNSELNSYARKILDKLDKLVYNIVELPTVVIAKKWDLNSPECMAVSKGLNLDALMQEINLKH